LEVLVLPSRDRERAVFFRGIGILACVRWDRRRRPAPYTGFRMSVE